MWWREAYGSISVKEWYVVVRGKDNRATRYDWTALVYGRRTRWFSITLYCNFLWPARYRTRTSCLWQLLRCRTSFRSSQRQFSHGKIGEMKYLPRCGSGSMTSRSFRRRAPWMTLNLSHHPALIQSFLKP